MFRYDDYGPKISELLLKSVGTGTTERVIEFTVGIGLTELSTFSGFGQWAVQQFSHAMRDRATEKMERKFSDVKAIILIELEELFNLARLRSNIVKREQAAPSKGATRVMGGRGPLLANHRRATLALPNPKVKQEVTPFNPC